LQSADFEKWPVPLLKPFHVVFAEAIDVIVSWADRAAQLIARDAPC
jgi:hypothetical protein